MERTDWLAWRRKGIGASDIAGILGISPWASPWSVWADKTGATDDDDDPTDAMTHGLWAEHAIIPWFEQETDLYVGHIQHQAEGAEPWMRATIDGAAFEHVSDGGDITNAVCLVECKATGDSPAKWEQGIPPMYAAQATWQAIVTGVDLVRFAVLHVPFGRITFRIYDFAPDAEDRELVEKAARTFWHVHVLTGTPPPADAHQATTEAIRARYDLTDPDDILFADPATSGFCHLLRAAKDDLAHAKAKVTELENTIKARMADCAVLSDGDRVLATWKAQDDTRLDVDRLRTERPELWAEYARTKTIRKFLLKTPKD